MLEGGLLSERWRPIKDYEDWYEISSNGDVRVIVDYLHGNYRKYYKGKILTPSKIKGKAKYLRIGLTNLDTGIRKSHNIHKLVAVAFIENPNNKPCVNHRNGNKLDNSVANLEWCTFSENTRHAWDTGLCKYLRGEASRNVKYTEVLINQILSRYYKDGLTCREIGDEYGIDKGYVQCVIGGRRWVEVFEEFRETHSKWFEEAATLLGRRRGNNIKQIKEDLYELHQRLA